MGNQIYFKIAGKKKNGSKGRTTRHIFGREPSKDYFIKILFLLSKWFQTKRILWEFPIGSYVKLSSAVVAILVRGLKCRTQFWKGTTQGTKFGWYWLSSFRGEDFFKISTPLFSIFNLVAILVGSRDHRTQGPFHQSLVAIGPVVSDKKIFIWFFAYLCLICIIGQHRKSSKFIKNPVIYVKKLIIMLIQFKFGHILA